MNHWTVLSEDVVDFFRRDFERKIFHKQNSVHLRWKASLKENIEPKDSFDLKEFSLHSLSVLPPSNSEQTNEANFSTLQIRIRESEYRYPIIFLQFF